MASKQVRSPGSRFGDDLYRLYLMGLGWLIFPVYGQGFAAALPTSATTMRWVLPVVAACLQLGWMWSGTRGGPMMVSRASVIHELGAPVSPRTVLAPQLLRQAVAWGAGGAFLGGALTSITDDYSFSVATPVSVAGFCLGFGAVALAFTIMVGVRRSSTTVGRLYVAAALLAAAAVAVTVAVAQTVSTAPVLAVLALVAVVSAGVAWHAMAHAPTETLWRRAYNLESARSAMTQVDFHRMLVDLRGAGDNRPAGTTRLPGRGWMAGWRALAPLRHAMPWSGLRLAAGLAAAALVSGLAPLDEGVVLLGLGAIWLAIGYELTRGISSVVDQVGFLVHYPSGSLGVLVGQIVVSFGLGASLIAVAHGWLFARDVNQAGPAVLIGAMGIVGGAMQARLGSPDTTKLVSTFGLQNAAAVLWARAAAAPIAMLAVVVFAFHSFRADAAVTALDSGLVQAAQTFLPLVFVAALVVCFRPLTGLQR